MKQIKVTDTRMQEVFAHRADGQQAGSNRTTIPVADAELIIITTENDYDGFDRISAILISRTEKISYGDWVYDPLNKQIFQLFRDNYTIEYYGLLYKILALPEHFSRKYLLAIVDGKLKEGKVLVECEKSHEAGQQTNLGQPILEFTRIKLNSSNHITLHKAEEKMVPVSLLHSAFEAGMRFIGEDKGSFNEWFEQNVK